MSEEVFEKETGAIPLASDREKQSTGDREQDPKCIAGFEPRPLISLGLFLKLEGNTLSIFSNFFLPFISFSV